MRKVYLQFCILYKVPAYLIKILLSLQVEKIAYLPNKIFLVLGSKLKKNLKKIFFLKIEKNKKMVQAKIRAFNFSFMR